MNTKQPTAAEVFDYLQELYARHTYVIGRKYANRNNPMDMANDLRAATILARAIELLATNDIETVRESLVIYMQGENDIQCDIESRMYYAKLREGAKIAFDFLTEGKRSPLYFEASRVPFRKVPQEDTNLYTGAVAVFVRYIAACGLRPVPSMYIIPELSEVVARAVLQEGVWRVVNIDAFIDDCEAIACILTQYGKSYLSISDGMVYELIGTQARPIRTCVFVSQDNEGGNPRLHSMFLEGAPSLNFPNIQHITTDIDELSGLVWRRTYIEAARQELSIFGTSIAQFRRVNGNISNSMMRETTREIEERAGKLYNALRSGISNGTIRTFELFERVAGEVASFWEARGCALRGEILDYVWQHLAIPLVRTNKEGVVYVDNVFFVREGAPMKADAVSTYTQSYRFLDFLQGYALHAFREGELAQVIFQPDVQLKNKAKI